MPDTKTKIVEALDALPEERFDIVQHLALPLLGQGVEGLQNFYFRIVHGPSSKSLLRVANSLLRLFRIAYFVLRWRSGQKDTQYEIRNISLYFRSDGRGSSRRTP